MYNEWYLKATNAERGIIAADRVTFGNYLKTKVAMLGYLYPNHPEIVAEVIMNEISNRTMDVCMMIQ